MARKSKMAKIDQPQGKLNVRLYLRVSTDRQAEEGYSLGIQEEKLRAFLDTMTGDIAYEVVCDDGYSGGDLNRPGIQRIIEEAEADAITHVVVVKLDRLSRSLKDTIYLIEDILLPHNVAFISLYESFDTSVPFGRAMIGILSVFAQFERENIYERTRSGMQKRVENGYWPGGGRVPYGYDYDANQGVLVPNSDADRVRYLYDQYLAGVGLQTIADQLGLKYEKVAYNILTRKSNAGYIVYNGEEYKGLHEPIVSLDVYNNAMNTLKERSARKFTSKSTHLLSGLVTCGHCGARMRYAKWGKNGCKLTCYSRQKSKPYLVHDPDCPQDHVWAQDVEEAVLKTLFSAAAKGQLAEHKKSIDGGSVLETLHRQIEVCKSKLRRLYDLYAMGDDDTLLDSITAQKAELATLEQQVTSEELQLQQLRIANQSLEKLEGLEDVWPLMSVAEQRLILASVVEQIIVRDTVVEIRLKYGLDETL